MPVCCHGSGLSPSHFATLQRQRQKTEVLWGIADFEHRYGRRPKGMWLAETAADTASLEALAEAGIEFTILAPEQIKAGIRPIGAKVYRRVNQSNLDTSRPYRLPSRQGVRIVSFHTMETLPKRSPLKVRSTTVSIFAHQLIDQARHCSLRLFFALRHRWGVSAWPPPYQRRDGSCVLLQGAQ